MYTLVDTPYEYIPLTSRWINSPCFGPKKPCILQQGLGHPMTYRSQQWGRTATTEEDQIHGPTRYLQAMWEVHVPPWFFNTHNVDGNVEIREAKQLRFGYGCNPII